MKKIFFIILLLIIIISSGVYSLLYVSFNLSDQQNPINMQFRRTILKNRFLTTILRLYQVGDARYEYMKNRMVPIDIHVFLGNGETLEEKTLETIAQQIQQVTFKVQKITVHSPVLLTQGKERVNDTDINALLDTYEFRSSFLSPTAPLNIFVLSEYEQYPSYAGLVVDANSIILFKKMIRGVSDHEPSPQSAEVSTILHEFGHLVGAEHIANTSCILAEKMENIDLFNRPSVFRESYCSEDLSAIMNAL